MEKSLITFFLRECQAKSPCTPAFYSPITKSYLEYDLYVFHFIAVNAYINTVDYLNYVGGLHYE